MRRRSVVLLSCLLSAPWLPPSAAAQPESPADAYRNVRIVMIVDEGHGDLKSFILTSAGGSARLDIPYGSESVDGVDMPVILHLEVDLDHLGEDAYLAEVVIGVSTPVPVATSTAANGARRSSVQYQKYGAETRVRLLLDEPLLLMKGLDKTVQLRLESAG